MKLQSFLLLLFFCCSYLLVTAKKVQLDGKEYTVSAYPEDCTKYLLCRKNVCSLMSCQYTYIFDPVTGTCGHRTRGIVGCDRRSPKRIGFR